MDKTQNEQLHGSHVSAYIVTNTYRLDEHYVQVVVRKQRDKTSWNTEA